MLSLVFYLEEIPDIHVSGHGYAEDLKKIILLAKARYLVPIGGTPESTKAYAKMAGGLNYNKNQVLLLKNGEVLEFSKVRGKPVPRVKETLSLREVIVVQD